MHIPLGWCSSGLDSAGLSSVSPEHTMRERERGERHQLLCIIIIVREKEGGEEGRGGREGKEGREGREG